jgi:lipoprotein
MKNIKILMIMGLLGLVTVAGSGCSKANAETEGNSVTNESISTESKSDKSESTPVGKKKTKRSDFKQEATLGTIGMIDLDENSAFPQAGFIETNDLVLGFDENKGELASCFFQNVCVSQYDAENIWHVEYSEDLDKIPSEMKGLNSIWDSFLEDERMYFMYSAQQYEIIPDNTEKVSYGGRDFIKEEGHIDVTRKESDDTEHPELVRTKYIAYYFFSPKDAGASAVDNTAGFGMGMAVWGVRPVDMSNEEEAKTMEENYEKLKKSAESSMSGLTSFQEYWKLED